MENIEALRFYYKGLPQSWSSVSQEDFTISDSKLAVLLKKFQDLPKLKKPIKVFSNNIKLIVRESFEYVNYSGVDFIKYFSATFNNQVDYQLPSSGDIVVIYNVGLEKVLNTQFSAKLLTGLIQQLMENNKHIVVDSHLSYSEFYKQYQIEFGNKIRIPEKKEEIIF